MRIVSTGLMMITLALGCPEVHAQRFTTILNSTNVESHSASVGLGDYYTVQLTLPQGVREKDLTMAVLELYVNVSSREFENAALTSARLEVYALDSAFEGSLDPDRFVPSTTRRTVPLGNGKRVLIDITEIVQYFLDDPTRNHGLVVGSLTGDRLGLFTLNADVLGPGAFGRVTFRFDAPEG